MAKVRAGAGKSCSGINFEQPLKRGARYRIPKRKHGASAPLAASARDIICLFQRLLSDSGSSSGKNVATSTGSVYSQVPTT